MINNKYPKVSIIIPFRNEEKYIESFIRSLNEQDYPFHMLEIIFVDGSSNDSSNTIIEKTCNEINMNMMIIFNEKKTVPYGMNLGIVISTGDYICRLDAHSYYPPNYISMCVNTIIKTQADNVGGRIITKSKGIIGNSFACILSTKLGVGNSRFRLKTNSGYVDTVPFGFFNKNIFNTVGLYDVRLTRNQDYELNYRIRKNGGKIFLNSDITLDYYSRDTLKGIIKQSFDNGKWNVITLLITNGGMSLRHFMPMMFLLYIIFVFSLDFQIMELKYIAMLPLLLYFILTFSTSIVITKKIYLFPVTWLLFVIFHLSYAIGSIFSFTYFLKRSDKNV